MKPRIKKALLGIAAVMGVGVLGAASFVTTQVMAFDASMQKVYDTPPVDSIKASTDPAILARGKHLVHGIAGCAANDCHGPDLAGGDVTSMGPIGTMSAPNITPGGPVAAYTDGELARLMRYGIKRDGRSAQFMPSGEFNWMPDSELTAVVSYLRSVPKSDKPNGPLHFGPFGKVLDRQGKLDIDIARKLAGAPIEFAATPEPTARYGRFLAKSCTGCHGEHLSGGPIPGAPSSLPVPLNLTPHETGMKGWTYDDFNALLMTGMRKNGQKLNPFMPIDAFRNADEVEKRALFAYLSTLEPRAFGGR
jgi:hypothetical protein